MTQARFEKISESDQLMYGPRKLLLCGFPPPTHSKFRIVLEYAAMADIPAIWVRTEDADTRISDLLELPDDSGWEQPSDLPRAVITSGIRQKELHHLMAVCRKTGMTQALWAALTPASETWTLNALLTELAAERSAFEKKE